MSDTWKCKICEREYHDEGGVEMYISDAGNNICEYCKNSVAFYCINKMQNSNAYYGSAECELDEIGTRWFATRKEAKNRIIEMIDKLWPVAERVEES